jgi:hypothetical protein
MPKTGPLTSFPEFTAVRFSGFACSNRSRREISSYQNARASILHFVTFAKNKRTASIP